MVKNDIIYLRETANCLFENEAVDEASKELFLEVYNLAKKENFIATDDISLIEKYRPDVKINYILANEENFKITTPLDLKLAKLIV